MKDFWLGVTVFMIGMATGIFFTVILFLGT